MDFFITDMAQMQPIPYSGKSTLLYTLNNPNAYGTVGYDYFGYSVGMDDNYAIVGAYREGDASGTQSGKAYIFDVTTGQLKWTLNNPNAYGTAAYDWFGQAVAISGNYAIVGAPVEDMAGITSSGRAYIFDVTTGQLKWTLNTPSTYPLESQFGQAVSISGNYVVVGAPEEDVASKLSTGRVYIFDVTTGQLKWTLLNPDADGIGSGDRFGAAVSISGNHILVGAWGEADGSGRAYIFDVTTGQLKWTLNNPNPYGTARIDYFARAVAICGNHAIAGAATEDQSGANDSGRAYIFDVTTGQLKWTLNNPNAYGSALGDNFGYSVALSTNFAIVGAKNEGDAGGGNSAKAYIFNVNTGQLLHTLDNPNFYGTSASDQFGWAVAISDAAAVVGAHLEDEAGGTDSGKAYIYRLG